MGLAHYESTVLAQTPDGLWPLNDKEASPQTFRDAAGGDALTVVGGVAVREDPIAVGLGHSVDLDGTGKLDSTITETWEGPWGWTTWLALADSPDATKRMVLFQPNGRDFPRLSIDWTGTTPVWRGEVRDSIGTLLVEHEMSADELEANVFHVALVHTDDELVLFLDAKIVASVLTPNALTASSPAAALRLGFNAAEADSGVIGRMAAPAVWTSKAPSSREIAEQYVAGYLARKDPEDIRRSLRRYVREGLGADYSGRVYLADEDRDDQRPQITVSPGSPAPETGPAARSPQAYREVVQAFTISVYPSDEGTPRECAVRADQAQASLMDLIGLGVGDGGPQRIPLYDYEGLSLNEPGPATPNSHAWVVEYPVRQIKDPDDPTKYAVVCDIRLNWRRIGPRPAIAPYAREIVPGVTVQ